ncbi:MAG: hypothetical protein O7G85_09355 [Planctomycetota bacterium]|nr:hypothetical protein [Planctomycetota bacterium]
MKEMYRTYGNDVQFYIVYIREAHALDSRSPMGGDGNPMIEDPVTLDERNKVAQVCLTKLELEMIPALVDDMDDTANNAYAAWPDRFYLVGRDGTIVYHGGRGPFGFLPDELEQAILKELGPDYVPTDSGEEKPEMENIFDGS